MAATTKPTTKAEQAKRFKRKKPIHVEMVDVHMPEIYDEPLTVPAFASFSTNQMRQFNKSDDKMFEALAEHAEPDVVDAIGELNPDELVEFIKEWRKAGSLSAPKSGS